MSELNLSYDSRDPNIRKAKFVLPNERVYTLEFDHNIQMQELKLMIQKAAHLRRNSFRLFSNGEEYTQYNEEIFDTLFPYISLVVFTLEPGGVESFDETELLLQMNSPCKIHVDKFLLYYCFTCNTSICSECFTNGIHKNHKIQDKCFYLLSSKYLVEKLFEKWSNNPYEDYNISVDLSQLKKDVNTVMFDKLFQMLKQIQERCNLLIDEYNRVNQNSLGNIRDSVRDIKVACIKVLDNLKEEINIKDIVNNTQIFVEFDTAYKELGKLQNFKFNQNLLIFQELNKKISTLVSDLIQRIYSSIYRSLENCLNDNSYENIKVQINKKFIKPTDKNEIMNLLSEQKKRRKTYINVGNIPKKSMDIELQKQDKNNSDQGKNMDFFKNNTNDNINEIKVNPFLSKDSYDSFNSQAEIKGNTMANLNINNNTKIKFGFDGNLNGQTNLHYSPLKTTAKFGFENSNIVTSNNDIKGEFMKPINTITNETNNINSNLNSNYGAQIKTNAGNIGSYSSAQATRQIISTNTIPKINIDTSNLYSANNNREMITFNNIDNTSSNLINNANNNIGNVINPFAGNKLNLNNNNKSVTTTSTQIITNHDNNQPQVYKTIETKTTTTTTKTVVPNNLITNIIDDNNTNTNMNMVNNIANTINSLTNMNNNGNVNKNTIISYTTNNNSLANFNKYLNKKNIIQEEIMTESETEIRRPTDIRRFLDTQYILCPVTQTNCIKIITSNDAEERTVPLKFPENYGFNQFFLDCAHCNCLYNKCLYVSGGIQISSSTQKKSKILLCIDITKPDDFKVVQKTSMNYARCGHTMISDGKYIYAVGGEDMDNVEKYDIDNDHWEILPNMLSKRMYPILYITNGYLYAFFGKYKNGSYPCSIERLNISGNSGVEKPVWEIITFGNKNNLDLRYYGCALHEIKGLLYFFGGKCNEQTTDKIFYYNFETRCIESEDSRSLWKEYFRENRFYKLGERLVQCSESKFFGVYIRLQEQ